MFSIWNTFYDVFQKGLYFLQMEWSVVQVFSKKNVPAQPKKSILQYQLNYTRPPELKA